MTKNAAQRDEISEGNERQINVSADDAKAVEQMAGSTVATDDAMVYEAATGKKVMIVEGDYRNIKLTTPEDMIMAEALVSR